jgi:FkbM family methyltransferase
MVAVIGSVGKRSAALECMVACEVRDVSFSTAAYRWRTDLGDDVGRSLWLTGGYQDDAVFALVRWLRRQPGDRCVIVDIGANIGTTAIPFAGEGFKVLAVEPVPATFAMLEENVRVNGLGDTVYRVRSAVSEVPGEVSMWSGFGSGQAEVAVDGVTPGIERWGDCGDLLQVPSSPLIDLIAAQPIDVGQIALVWADVQGSETAVIRTGLDLWASGVPLYLEVDPFGLNMHAGIDAFVTAVAASFTTFVERDVLVDREWNTKLRPISEFGDWVEAIASVGPGAFSDALLVP